ncbi:O-methyltransferase [Thalassospira sp. CH_XMU1448-2]|jgi:predicted O-methyltransferase YrrM|uniref:O-methyltransferase n=1 Tax=Thalassospira sp. CH_XMU1448-2 TaxID=3107773 RepID=UPI00300BAD7E
MDRSDYRSLFQRIVSAFEEEGYPHNIIGQWTLPENDVEDMLDALLSKRPKRLLEVGTFVGMSTMLLALASDDDAHIVSVDPNYPISREMLSMGSSIGEVAHERRTQEIAKAVAQRLGVDEKITFVSGGFAVDSSFASRRTDEASDISVVGAEICKNYGPFDFVLVDGLHYADAVEEDLNLAASAMAQSGIMLAHDCIGMWGTNVRTGVKRFLLKNPEWGFTHKPYADVYRSFGTLFRRDQPPVKVNMRAAPLVPATVKPWLFPLVSNVINLLQPNGTTELFLDHSVLGAIKFKNLEFEGIKLGVASPNDLNVNLLNLTKGSILVSVGALDCIDDAKVCAVFEAVNRTNSNMLMFCTFPGENDIACTHSRSLPRWIELANEAGLDIRNADTLSIAPSRFSFIRRGASEPQSSALSAPLFLTADRSREIDLLFPIIDRYNAERVEEQWLLDVHYAAAFDKLLSEHEGAASEIERLKGERDELLCAISQSAIARVLLRRKLPNLSV